MFKINKNKFSDFIYYYELQMEQNINEYLYLRRANINYNLKDIEIALTLEQYHFKDADFRKFKVNV